MFKKLLIANRGEIACRIMQTCRRLGIRTVAVYSDIDRNALHVDMADEAVMIGTAAPQESYLNIPRILAAAKESGAEAVHPGYGFLSENAGFAEAVTKAGMAFIGPSADAIRAMGEKSTAKSLMEKAGVPMLPGYHGAEQSETLLLKEAEKIGFPLLIKASAGGGGKGMRIVRGKKEFKEALAAAKREAQSSFGNDHVLLEKFLDAPRHIEVQIFGDSHGNVLALSERDCSVQRRQQKIIEEAPAPGLSAAARERIADAARKTATAIDYTGAGTVEFLTDDNENFYFMEMNTRLQVEHPVTEMVTGLDLVEWQLLVAAGNALPLQQKDVQVTGHAFEARIYAEDPDTNFLPATGKISHLTWPESRAALRVETGIRAGDTVSAYYDPMIAKLVIHAENREAACAAMADVLHETRLVGPKNNIRFLETLCRHPAFAGETPQDLSTKFIENYEQDLFRKEEPTPLSCAVAAVTLLRAEISCFKYGYDLKGISSGWRMNGEQPMIRRYKIADRIISCHLLDDNLAAVTTGDTVFEADFCTESETIHIGGTAYHAASITQKGKLYLFCDKLPHLVLNWRAPLDAGDHSGVAEGALTAPMTGRVIALHVAKGDKVLKGQALAVIEAMKMEHTISAPAAGTVANVNIAVDMQVNEGVELITLENNG
ncbi:MAG: acetyl-CoA carboxylase biotin carboxylase subunit [Pseudomonadota bacterium]|nr:acetyl-CoA carboxylase biotin carboxylase subunit [Pseudomonadota bacterium]QKK05189.1 MAG: acetyl-CoA carboxylase biotin carboxylase subunit [Pseudomonadota bacterium]